MDRTATAVTDGDGDGGCEDDEIMVTVLLNHFLEVLQFNSHEVAQFEMLAKNKVVLCTY